MNRRTSLAGILFALVSGCTQPEPDGGSGSSTPTSSATPAGSGPGSTPASGMKVGLLTNGALTDSGWNSLAGKGLESIAKELGATTSHQNQGAAGAEEALRGFARDGCKLVFAHGTEFGDAASRVAKEYASTIFVISSGEVTATNVASLKFELGEAAYLAGMVAAGLSKAGKGGQIGGQDFPPVVQGFKLFERGAQAINPKFTTSITYLGNWSDANAAKEKALAMIRDGADVIFQNSDAAGEGIFQAALASKDGSVLVFGSNANQNDLQPTIIPASAVLDVAKIFLQVAKEVSDGSFTGKVYVNDLKSGNVYLAINPAFEAKIPADVKKKVEQAEADIKSGKLKLLGG